MPSSWRTCANFFGSARRRSLIVARSAAIPASVKTRAVDGHRCQTNPRQPAALIPGSRKGIEGSCHLGGMRA
jgi:hypothetical protein